NAWSVWRSFTGKQRGEFLRRIAENIEHRADEIARTITFENGKPLAQSRGEVAMTVDHLQWFAEEARRAYGRVVPQQAEGKRHLVLKQPVGVVGAIAPWNFPLVLAVRKVAPALAAGCPVVLKPASATPLSSLALAEAVHEVGLPAGVFQLVVGRAQEIAAEMFSNPNCRKVTFTGSTEVGHELIRLAATNVTKLSLELGGHAPFIVFDDADLDLAVEGALIAKFRNTGQSCIAANRIYVQRGIYEVFVERFVEGAKSLKVGDGLGEGVEIGPLIDEQTLQNALGQITNAKEQGGRVLCGGQRWDGGTGCFLEPTVLSDVPMDALCMSDETFAPVVPVVPFETEDEVIRQANDTRYGLAAYFFTNNLARAWRVAESLEAGTVAVNDSVPATSQCPFGGMKQSGLGRELGSEGLDAYLEVKHVSFGGIE
ncbi:MAG: NAD-dependent succinate-semialdehyde dehydrogenase, partial [Planctomycetaceae bacterium]|nr:NAD-dependent succinate-semialdehyde dehydrogenase [Planctomycetaceae bacterium]